MARHNVGSMLRGDIEGLSDLFNGDVQEVRSLPLVVDGLGFSLTWFLCGLSGYVCF